MSTRRSTLRRAAVLTAMALTAGFTVSGLPSSMVTADAAELFISEYIEGSSNNKAIEIHNATGAAVDLMADVYDVQMSFNGGTSVLTIGLTGTVADGDVYVLAQASANAAILAQADQINAAGWFNGDDAVVLRKNAVIIDSIGQVGFDPGTEWGTGLVSTMDNTLRRRSSICAGDIVSGDPFDPLAEWDGFAVDTVDGLGSHTADCDGAGGPGDPTVVINELDSDTPGTDAAEFVELFDGGSGNTPLDGLVVVFYNGSNDLSYAAFDLDGFTTDADGYFVLGNAGLTPDIVFASNGLQNGADAVAVYAADAAAFPTNTPVSTTELVDAVVYDTADADDTELLVLLNGGQPQVDENGGGAGADDSIQRCPDGSGGARNTDTFATWVPTPGAANVCEIVIPPLTCSADAVITPIHDVQGNGLTSPIVASIVEIDGVVVGDFQNNGQPDDGDLNGFHVQEEDTDADADPSTSEGVFVFAPAATDVAVGDHVRVRGTVTEFPPAEEPTDPTLTEISDAAVAACDDPAILPTVTQVTLPVGAIDDLERYEGMYVTFPQALSISEYFNFDRFGEMVLTYGRQFQPTAVFEPGSPDAAALASLNLRSRITLDDGRSAQNPDPAIHPNGTVFDLTNRFRGGDLVQNATGVIDHSFGLYRIQPTEGADYTAVNTRPDEPFDVGGTIQVASFNVLNYFNGDGQGGGFPTSRGALDANEFERQRDKIIDAIGRLEAEVVGVMEIENDGYDQFSAIQDLVKGLNDLSGAGTWAFIDPAIAPETPGAPGIGTDEIAVGLLYQPAAVSPVGAAAILDSTVDPRFDDTANRPALAQSFIDDTTGGVFTVAVNHLKSKGSACGPDDDDPQQGNCNGTRTSAAAALAGWLATDPTGSGDPDVLIIGDLNAYDKEDPIDALIAAGYADLHAKFEGEFAYTYLFDGQLGYLDHALSNPALSPHVTGAAVWHINADEPDIFDYLTLFKAPAQDALYEPNAYRSSDHDPVIVGLGVCDAIAPKIDVRVTPKVLWPPNHKYVTVRAEVTATDNFDTNPTVTLLSVTSDEPDNGRGDGNTKNDIVIVNDTTFKLRAERSDRGDGRTYTITYQVTDDCGNTARDSATVTVPKRKPHHEHHRGWTFAPYNRF